MLLDAQGFDNHVNDLKGLVIDCGLGGGPMTLLGLSLSRVTDEPVVDRPSLAFGLPLSSSVMSLSLCRCSNHASGLK